MKLNIKERGFTLVEVLVALAILTVALIPVFIQSSVALKLATQTQNSITATYLAQEGVEIIQAIRDDDWYRDSNFGDSFIPKCSDGCRVQYDSAIPTPIPTGPGNNPFLKQDANGLFNYNTGEDTIFRRKITAEQTGDRILIVAEVSWTDQGASKSYSLPLYLYNWLPNPNPTPTP